jgi:hypothetical protein
MVLPIPSHAPRPTLAEVKSRVRAEHATLRALLARVAEAAAEGRSESELRDAIWDLDVAFADHLAMEEADLVPLVRALDPLGPARVAAMLEEHREQRAALTALVRRSETGKTSRGLAEGALYLVDAVLRDMELEEAQLGRVREPVPRRAARRR